jgi:hypothetical protein
MDPPHNKKKLAPPAPPATERRNSPRGRAQPARIIVLAASSICTHPATPPHTHTHRIAHHDPHIHQWPESTHPTALPMPDARVGGGRGSTLGSTKAPTPRSEEGGRDGRIWQWLPPLL